MRQVYPGPREATHPPMVLLRTAELPGVGARSHLGIEKSGGSLGQFTAPCERRQTHCQDNLTLTARVDRAEFPGQCPEDGSRIGPPLLHGLHPGFQLSGPLLGHVLAVPVGQIGMHFPAQLRRD